MPAWVGWALAAVVLLAAAIWLALKLRGKGVDVLRAGAQMLTEWHKQNIKRTQKRIDNLKVDFDNNSVEIAKLEAKLAVQRAKLSKELAEKELSAEEIAKQFAELDL